MKKKKTLIEEFGEDAIKAAIMKVGAPLSNGVDDLDVIFQGKRYPVVDFQGYEPEVGIFSSYFTFCLTADEDDEGLTIDAPSGENPNEKLNVYDNNGNIMGQGQIVKKLSAGI